MSFSLFGQHEISVLIELTVGHLRFFVTDVQPQSNSPPDHVFRIDRPSLRLALELEPVKTGPYMTE